MPHARRMERYMSRERAEVVHHIRTAVQTVLQTKAIVPSKRAAAACFALRVSAPGPAMEEAEELALGEARAPTRGPPPTARR